MQYQTKIADLQKCWMSESDTHVKDWLIRKDEWGAPLMKLDKVWIRFLHNKYKNQILFFKKYGRK